MNVLPRECMSKCFWKRCNAWLFKVGANKWLNIIPGAAIYSVRKFSSHIIWSLQYEILFMVISHIFSYLQDNCTFPTQLQYCTFSF